MAKVARIAYWIACILTLVAMYQVFKTVLQNPTPLKPWAYPWISVPLFLVAIPFRRTERAYWSALGFIAYIYCPLSLSIGILFVPAVLAMTGAALFSWLRSRRAVSTR
jgi:hypothetical protein